MSSAPSDLIAVELGETKSNYFELGLHPDPNGTVLGVSWKGLPNRNPNKSGDFVAIWQNSNEIPFGTPPLNTQPVTNAGPDGDVAFTGLQLASLPYTVGYSVGPDTSCHEIAATISIGPGGAITPTDATVLSIGYVGATSLVIDYTTPSGTTPKAFGHTVVLVKGRQYPASGEPVATAKPSENSKDAVSFNNVTMVKGQPYTVAYVTGVDSEKKPLPSSVAATVTFQVASA